MLEGTAVGLSFALFRKIFPLKEVETRSPEEMLALDKIYMKWNWISLPFLLVYVLLTGFLWFLFLGFLGDLAKRSHPSCVVLNSPDRFLWLLPSMFLGIISAAVPLHFTFLVMLGDRYEEFTVWGNLKNGYDGWRAFRWLALVIGFFSAIGVEAGLRVWDEFHEDRVVFMRPWYWNPRTYPYAQVKAIARFARLMPPNGQVRNDPYTAIRFNDGTSWTTRQQMSRLDEKRKTAIIELVSSRSGRPVQQLDLWSDWKD